MTTPRILPGRMPDDLRELTADIAGLSVPRLLALGEALRRFFAARTGAREQEAVTAALSAFDGTLIPTPAGTQSPTRWQMERLGLAYEVATGEQLVKGGLVARLINRKLEG